MNTILALWKKPIWEGSLPTLIHHLLHVTGGMAVILVFVSLGVDRLVAGIISSALFTFIEATTAIFKKNYLDSFFDWYQYQVHWILYLAAIGDMALAGLILVGWLVGYFVILLAGNR